jgi:uncharacterized protein (DUF1015 family)
MAWRKHKRAERDSKKNRARHAEATSSRLSQVFSSTNGVEDADPEEVEARIRNMFYGSKREQQS